MGADIEDWTLGLHSEDSGRVGYCYAVGCGGLGQSTLRFEPSPPMPDADVNGRITAARDTAGVTLVQWIAGHSSAVATWLSGLPSGEAAKLRTAAGRTRKLDMSDTPD